MFYAPPQVGSTHTSGLVVTEVEKIEWGIFKITFDDNTDRVWLDDRRLQDAPDIELDGKLADIQDLDNILEHYDIEWVAFCADTGEYQYKKLRHDNYPYQCSVMLMLKDKSTIRWTALCDDMGNIEKITTDTGKDIKTLADFREIGQAMGVVDATFVNEYNIVDF